MFLIMHLNISRNIKNMTTSIPLTSSWTISVVGKSENQSRVVEFGLFPDFRVILKFLHLTRDQILFICSSIVYISHYGRGRKKSHLILKLSWSSWQLWVTYDHHSQLDWLLQRKSSMPRKQSELSPTPNYPQW